MGYRKTNSPKRYHICSILFHTCSTRMTSESDYVFYASVSMCVFQGTQASGSVFVSQQHISVLSLSLSAVPVIRGQNTDVDMRGKVLKGGERGERGKQWSSHTSGRKVWPNKGAT